MIFPILDYHGEMLPLKLLLRRGEDAQEARRAAGSKVAGRQWVTGGGWRGDT